MNKKLTVLLYIPSLPQEFGGVRQYSAGLLKLIAGMNNRFKFLIYHDGNDPNIVDILSENKQLTLVKPYQYRLSKVDRIKNSFKYYGAKILVKVLGRSLPIEKKTDLDRVVQSFDVDVVHCPYQFLPEISRTIKRPVKRIITLHDVQELHFPEFFSAMERANRAVNYMKFIRDSDRVIVSYMHVKEDLVKFFEKDEGQISVLLLKMDNLWFKKFDSLPSINMTLFDDYLFFPANFWKHKNHERLIKAIHFLQKTRNLTINLVLTGDHNTSQGAVLNKLLEEYKLSNQVRILGIVDEATLYHLYRNALGVVVPTLYEAGSFPLMESILMEVPVICSDITSLPETIGDSRFIFNPLSIEDMADKIALLWTDEQYRKLSVENSRKQQSRLIDTGAASILESIYNAL